MNAEQIIYDNLKDKLSKDNEELLNFDIDSLDGYGFELYCGRLLKSIGYSSVENTKASQDYGIDIVAEKDELTYGIQCKRFSSPVGVKAVQEVSAGSMYYQSDRAVVLTNNYFTPAALNLAKRTGVLLWDRDCLLQMQEELKERVIERQSVAIEFENELEKLISDYRKVKEKKHKIIRTVLLLAIGLASLTILLYPTIKEKLREIDLQNLTNIAQEVFLEAGITVVSPSYELINVETDYDKYDVYYISYQASNFESLSYEEMADMYRVLNKKLMLAKKYTRFYAEIKHINSNGQIFTISSYDDTKIVWKNNVRVFDKEAIEKAQRVIHYQQIYGDILPQLGMREEAIGSTVLGEPDRIELSQDFDKKVLRAREKTLYWDACNFQVRICYTYNVDGTVYGNRDCPEENGYVWRIYFVENHVVQSEDLSGTNFDLEEVCEKCLLPPKLCICE